MLSRSFQYVPSLYLFFFALPPPLPWLCSCVPPPLPWLCSCVPPPFPWLCSCVSPPLLGFAAVWPHPPCWNQLRYCSGLLLGKQHTGACCQGQGRRHRDFGFVRWRFRAFWVFWPWTFSVWQTKLIVRWYGVELTDWTSAMSFCVAASVSLSFWVGSTCVSSRRRVGARSR